ncbi:MAG: type II toxin-antitoxin system VapC family toxin [Coriobacteriia bacterium]|nr:type II toxin-antitoxin system VapC family toxin [Coriobacteriia bacterium]
MSNPLRVATGAPMVVDSSIAFKWFDTSESGAAIAGDLLDAHRRDDVALLAPAHLPLEVVNAYVCRGGVVSNTVGVVADLAAMDLLIAPVDEALLIAAVRIAEAEHLALYDAVFIALAAALDAELVTADRRQAETRSCRVRFVE